MTAADPSEDVPQIEVTPRHQLPDTAAHFPQVRAIKIQLHGALTIAGQHLDDGLALGLVAVVAVVAVVLNLYIDVHFAAKTHASATTISEMQNTHVMILPVVLMSLMIIALAIDDEETAGALIAITLVLPDELPDVLGEPFQVNTEVTGYVGTVVFS